MRQRRRASYSLSEASAAYSSARSAAARSSTTERQDSMVSVSASRTMSSSRRSAKALTAPGRTPLGFASRRAPRAASTLHSPSLKRSVTTSGGKLRFAPADRFAGLFAGRVVGTAFFAAAAGRVGAAFFAAGVAAARVTVAFFGAGDAFFAAGGAAFAGRLLAWPLVA